ncbi:MAG: DNA polymerase III subunit alpha [Bacilli bacterium]|nr:DNA polymerase III subunit alpha [Bacilli bacterium]
MIYTPLYIKTDYSLLSSLIKIDDLIDFSKKNNIKSLSITDDNLCGVIEFYNKCVINNIKPIIGLELNIKDVNLVIYAKNYNGYLNLIKLMSLKDENTLTLDNLNENLKDVILIIPFKYQKLISKFKCSDIFIGFNNKEEEQSLGDNKIYLNETLYLEKEDYKYLKYLAAIKDDSSELIDIYNDNYLKLERDLDYDLTNNFKLYDICNVELKFNQKLIPKYNCPDNLTSFEYLKKLCIEGLKRIFGDSVSIKYKERLKYELSVINEMNFCDYFLIVWDYVRFAKENGILVGPGRGSASGSLVSYLLNIIEIDPLKYNLLFERFLNKDRVTMPDIDIDFDGERIEEVIDYCKNLYGVKNVASIVTYSSLSTKQVLRDVGKVLKINDDEVDYFIRMFDRKDSIIENYNNSDRIKNHIIKNPELKELFDISLKLENIKKHISVHASGVIISDKELDNVIPLIKYKDEYLTGYQAEFLEHIGLIKMDFLSLKTLTTINSLISNIKDIDFNNIPLNDVDTINIFKTGNTLGIFQFESNGMIDSLKKYRASSFEDIYNIMALYRPGPMDSIDSYIKRKDNLESVDYYDARLEPILKPTYGIIIYQEQIMQLANTMASYTMGEADILRRAMSKKKEEVLIAEKDKFITRSIENGYSSEVTNRIYNLILKFAEYGFNKAHAVAYSVISYKMAYIKAHYPVYFMKEMLDSAIGSNFDTKERIANAKDNGIKILNPDINKSNIHYVIDNNNLIYPFINIKGMNIPAINNIVMNRNEHFKDIFDFVKKVDLKIVNKDIITSLIYTGSFDSLGINRKTLIENIDVIINYAELVSDLDDDSVETPNLIEYLEYTDSELMRFEYEYLNLYLSNHPVTEYRKKYNYKISTKGVSSYMGKNIHIIGKVERFKKIVTKTGTDMAFMKIADEYGSIECTLFNSTLNNTEEVNIDDIVIVYGKSNSRNGKDQIIANEVKVIEKNKT